MKISSCSRVFAWPTYSASSFGRSARSIASSFGDAGAADTTRFSGSGARSSVLIVIASSRQRLQRLLDAFAHADVAGQRLQRRGRFLVDVAERDQRLQDVGLRVALRRRRGNADVRADLALQLEEQARGRLLADAGHLHEPRGVLR